MEPTAMKPSPRGQSLCKDGTRGEPCGYPKPELWIYRTTCLPGAGKREKPKGSQEERGQSPQHQAP